MRRISDKLHKFLKKRQHRWQREQRLAANFRRNRKRSSVLFKKEHEEYYKRTEDRERFRRQLYHKYRGYYTESPATVDISGEFGIEDSAGIEYFLDRASAIIDFDNTRLTINLRDCTRVWPSAITLLCSLKQWVELSTSASHRPRIASTSSTSDKVNSYLAHSGFYSYVNRLHDAKQDYYSDKEIVKIHRETKTSNIEIRENEMVALLEQYSMLTAEQIELFDSKVLTEAFNNVTEHGVSHIDKGWWVLAQYHKKHGIISFCIADNGIGIRNTLMTGPQANDIAKKLANTSANDGAFIKMSLEETVSGALKAPRKTKKTSFISSTLKYESGSHRGNGLKRIRDTCTELNIPFAVFSHHGYAFIDESGAFSKHGSMERRVFAGTLYHMSIPARKEI